jgi:16S rRNA (uracil1498-N3)-methyltransferase
VNLILVEEGGGDAVVLRGRRARHAREVLRARVGDELRVGLARGPRGVGRVVSMRDDEVTLECRLEAEAPPPPWLDVILAVPRPKVLLRALEALASFGARRIDLVNAWRVDKSFFGSRRLDETAVREALVLGCEQGGGTWIPEIAVRPLLVPFLRETLAPRLAAEPSRRRLLFHPEGAGIENVALGGADVICAVGPEGGWIASELQSFAELGFVPVALGPAVLRVEAAVAALAGQLWLWRRLT